MINFLHIIFYYLSSIESLLNSKHTVIHRSSISATLVLSTRVSRFPRHPRTIETRVDRSTRSLNFVVLPLSFVTSLCDIKNQNTLENEIEKQEEKKEIITSLTFATVRRKRKSSKIFPRNRD